MMIARNTLISKDYSRQVSLYKEQGRHIEHWGRRRRLLKGGTCIHSRGNSMHNSWPTMWARDRSKGPNISAVQLRRSRGRADGLYSWGDTRPDCGRGQRQGSLNDVEDCNGIPRPARRWGLPSKQTVDLHCYQLIVTFRGLSKPSRLLNFSEQHTLRILEHLRNVTAIVS